MPDKTTPISLRLDKTVLNRLREESDIEGISLNALMNRIVEEYIDWHRYAPKAGFVAIPKPLLIRLMQRVSPKELAKVSEFLSKSEIKGILMLLRKKWDISSFLDALQAWARASGLSFRHDIEGDSDLYIIQHDMGLKWSTFMGTIWKLLLVELTPREFRFEVTDNVISFKIRSKKLGSKSRTIAA